MIEFTKDPGGHKISDPGTHKVSDPGGMKVENKPGGGGWDNAK
ncbi:hypothetical protein [Bacillus manliponensis]|nr:hypothetical protein [Bacillus manliponensis]